MIAGQSEVIGAKYRDSPSDESSTSSLRTSSLFVQKYNRDPWEDILPDTFDNDSELNFLDLTPFLRSVRNGDVCLLHYKYRDQGRAK